MGYPAIVLENVTQTVAPVPLTYQATGAIISQGGTTNASGTYSLITQDSDLTPLLSPALAISSITWSGGTALVTTSAPLSGVAISDSFLTTIAGVTPAGYNGQVSATVTGSNTFTYALAVNPGAETVPGTYTPNNVGELTSAVTDFFDQGGTQAVYVLELGAGDGTSGPPALQTWIQNNPGVFCAYLVPRYWDSTAAYLAFLANYESPSSKTYFVTTTTNANYGNYTAQMKDVVAIIQSPLSVRPIMEFTAAATLQNMLAFAPSSSNLMTPLGFKYQYGVTPYPLGGGNGALFTAWQNAGISFIGTGAEGGITNAVLFGGTTKDGNDYSYWYSIDWIQLNADQAIANAILNAANNALAPIYYNQDGVNTLQDVILGQVQNAVSFGLATGTVQRSTLTGVALAQALENGQFTNSCVVNAVPFVTYATQNPANYAKGIYGGFSIIYLVNRTFKQILLNINATSLVSQ